MSAEGRRHRRPGTARRSSPGPRPAPGTCRTAPAPHGGDRAGRHVRPDRRLADRARLPLEAGGVIARALSVQRAPWGNMYEFSTTFSTVAVGVYLGCCSPGRTSAGSDCRWSPPSCWTWHRRHLAVHRERPAGSRAGLVLAVDPRLHRDLLRRGLLPGRGRHRCCTSSGTRTRTSWRTAASPAPSPRSVLERLPPRPRPSTSSPTASTPPSSRCGPSRSSPARSGPATPGAATGAGTPRKSGPSSPGSRTPRICTPARPPAGRAARPRTSR